MDLTPEPELSVFLGARNTGLRLSQRSKNFLSGVPDRGHDTHPSHNYAPHALLHSCGSCCRLLSWRPGPSANA